MFPLLRVVIDSTRAPVAPTNFAEAAQSRITEGGVVADAALARRLRALFDALVGAWW